MLLISVLYAILLRGMVRKKLENKEEASPSPLAEGCLLLQGYKDLHVPKRIQRMLYPQGHPLAPQ